MVLAVPSWFLLASGAVVGAVLGSFLNVCIYRIPRGLSVVFPPSACPHCQAPIAPYDNLPIVAWLLLRGRCRRCRGPIAVRYPLVEALTAVVFALLVRHYGWSVELIPALYFAAAMLLVTFVDLDAYLIPDVVTLPGIALGILASLITPLRWWESVAGAALGFGFLFLVGWVYRRVTGVEGMGGGDVKLAAMMGAFLGWTGVILAVFFASAAGSLFGLSLVLAGRGQRRTALPFGTFLAPAALVVYVWGGDLVAWWFARFGL